MACCATLPSGSNSLSIASWSLATVNACSSLSTGLILTTCCQLKDSGLKTHTEWRTPLRKEPKESENLQKKKKLMPLLLQWEVSGVWNVCVQWFT